MVDLHDKYGIAEECEFTLDHARVHIHSGLVALDADDLTQAEHDLMTAVLLVRGMQEGVE